MLTKSEFHDYNLKVLKYWDLISEIWVPSREKKDLISRWKYLSKSSIIPNCLFGARSKVTRGKRNKCGTLAVRYLIPKLLDLPYKDEEKKYENLYIQNSVTLHRGDGLESPSIRRKRTIQAMEDIVFAWYVEGHENWWRGNLPFIQTLKNQELDQLMMDTTEVFKPKIEELKEKNLLKRWESPKAGTATRKKRKMTRKKARKITRKMARKMARKITRKISRKQNKRTKKEPKQKKETKQKKVIHQIFYNIGKGELKDIKPFYKCYKHNKEYCKANKIQYKLWSRKQVEKLLDKPQNKEYKKLYYDFDQDIMRIDFGRYLILWNFGGIYIDLDICIIKNKSISHLFDKEHFFVKWNDKSKLPYNAVLGTKKNNPLYKDILDHCKESYYEKRKQDIYKTWKGRFVFQTTGHYMLQRVLKKHKIKDFLNIMKIHTKSGKIVRGPKPLFEDSNASVWYDGK